MATLSPSSVAFGNQNTGTTSSAQTITLSNGGNATLGISGIAIGGTNAGDFASATSCGSSVTAGGNCTITVTFTPTAAGARSASLNVTDNAAGSPQSVSLTGTGVSPPFAISPTSATVLLGSTQAFTITDPGTCASALFGNVPVSGLTATYTVPQAVPSAWTDMLTCTETSGGTQVAAGITLQYPVPTIMNVIPETLGTMFVFDTGSLLGNAPINGTGFLPDENVTISPDPSSFCGASYVSWTQFAFAMVLGPDINCVIGGATLNWDPGFLGITVADPATGHGGGTSNPGNIAFLGDQNLLAWNATDAFLLDPQASTICKFKLADGSSDGCFAFTLTLPAPETGTGFAISIDDATGDLVLFATGDGDGEILAFNPATDAKVVQYNTNRPIHGGAAKGSWAVFSTYALTQTQALPTLLGRINLTNPSDVFTQSVNNTPQNFPWDFQLTNLNGNLTAVVWSIENGVLSTIAVPSLQVVNSVTLSNIATTSTLGTHPLQGGWQLQVFDSGPSQGTAVLLSQYDQVLVYVNLATMTEIKRVDLAAAQKSAGLPVFQSFRLGKDESDGSIAVAFADPLNGRTTAITVGANGTVAPLKTTEPFLATGFQLSADGTQIYWGNRSAFAATPKQ